MITVDFYRDGRTVGILGVNGYAGQVWYHTWSGAFIIEKEIGSWGAVDGHWIDA